MVFAPKLVEFDAKEAFRNRSLDELNSYTEELNELKEELSKNVDFYLKNRKELGLNMKIPRLCQALAGPDALASKVLKEMKIPRTSRYGYLETDETLAAKNRMLDVLVPKLDNYYDNLDKEQRRAVNVDVNELMVYSDMYTEIEFVKDKDIIKDFNPAWYPDGNTFDYVFDIMEKGANIVRFRYVSRNGSVPSEKVTSYHFVNSVGGPELAVHVEGDRRFSMRKMWGYGDETLEPLSGWYKDTVIRWGKDDVQKVLDGKKDGRRHLY